VGVEVPHSLERITECGKTKRIMVMV